MSEEPVIFLDMDGVLSNFVQGALRLFDQPGLEDVWTPADRNMPALLGMSGDAFWNRIAAAGSDFWFELEPYPWLDELVSLVDRWPWFIATSPGTHESSAAGKVQWMKHHLGSDFRNYLITPQKQVLARPGAILIDDLDPNVDRFNESGGEGLLFPRKWNTNYTLADDPMSFVAGRLAEL